MAYATVTLTGTYQTPDGTPHKGHVEIIPSERVIKDTTGDVILTGRVKVDLDAQGAFSVVLPATDDESLNPTGFGYTIAAKLHSSHPPAVSFSLPAALGATTVEDLTPVDPSTFAPTTTYAETSTVTALDSRVTTVESDIAGKANSADLATVATTGNYTDLTGQPSIPATAADVNALPDTTTPSDIGAVPLEQRPDPFPPAFLSYAKGGVVGTNGRIPVALRFDDWQDQIITQNLITEMNNRGLFGSIVLCTELGSNPWNQTITWDTLRTWSRTYGMEIWSHGTDHNSPYDPDPATFSANLRREIVESRQHIEDQNLRCMGWAMPGVGFQPDGVTGGYGSFLMTQNDWQTEAGRLLTATYGVVETDMTDKYRHIPSRLTYGLGHATVSDGATLQASKDVLDGAIALGFGVEFMCHAGNLGGAGNITVAQFLEFLDYIVTKRDAGDIEFVAPSTLPFCDPTSTHRLNLVGNGDFEAPIPLGSQSVFGNWRNVDGVNRYITNVTGHEGTATNVLHCQGNTLITQVCQRTKGRGISGQTLILDAWVRCTQVNTVTTSSVRFTAQDSDNPANYTFDKTAIPVTTTWKRIRIPFSPPMTTDNISFAIGRGTTVGSGQIEWDDVKVYVA